MIICRDFVEIGGQLTSDPHKITSKVGVGCQLFGRKLL